MCSSKVVGYVRNGIRIFKGIPYAEILSPQDRWKRGAGVRPWAGERSSRAAGFICSYQAPGSSYGSSFSVDEVAIRDSDYECMRAGEDCLRVNVWTPGIDSKKWQVLVWCHGGGYIAGSPLMSSRYEAPNLARYGDVVVVSMTHRLHAPGLPSMTG